MLSRAQSWEGDGPADGRSDLGLRTTRELLQKSSQLICLDGVATTTPLLSWWLPRSLGTGTSQQHWVNLERDYSCGLFCNLV